MKTERERMMPLSNIPINTFGKKSVLLKSISLIFWLSETRFVGLNAGISALPIQSMPLAWLFEFPKLETASFIASMSALLQAL